MSYIAAPRARPALALAGLLAACGGSSTPVPRAAERVSNVDVAPPAATESASQPDDGAVAESTPDAQSSSLEACALAYRADPDLGATPDERAAYRQAVALDQAGKLADARRAYFEIVSKTPKSPYVPLVYLAFGERFAEEARNDPAKWALAQQAYQQVTRYPPPENLSHAYAQLRLAEVETAQGDRVQALAGYKHALDGVRHYPDSACAAATRAAARRGLVDAYAEVGTPNRAAAFFRVIDGDDRGASLLAALAEEYARRGAPRKACAALDAAPADVASELVEARRAAGCR